MMRHKIMPGKCITCAIFTSWSSMHPGYIYLPGNLKTHAVSGVVYSQQQTAA